VCLCRKVYLGYKKTNPCRKYAIKVMKKVDMINKNMASQGTSVHLSFTSLYLLCAPGGGGGYTPSVRPVRPIFSSTKAIETCNLVETALEKSN